MSLLTRILTFRSHNLGKDSVLVLTFDDTTPGIYDTVFPTAHKVSAFGKCEDYEFTYIFHAQLGFIRAHVSSGSVVTAGTYTKIYGGQKTILTKAGNPPIYSFSTPEPIEPPTNQIVAYNNTDARETLAIGPIESNTREPSPALVFEQIGAGSSVQIDFSHILGGYITSGYQQNAVIRGQIPSPLLFKEDLIKLPAYTNWKIEYHCGEYKITRDFDREKDD